MFVLTVFIPLLNLPFVCLILVQSDACNYLGLTNDYTLSMDESCFEISRDEQNFAVARKSCTRHETGHLAQLNADQINVLIDSGLTYFYYWVGLMQLSNGTEPGGGWHWITNDRLIPALEVPWQNGKPDDIGGDRDCAYLHRTYAAIIDDLCSWSITFICQYHFIPDTTTTTMTPTTTSSTTTTTTTTSSKTTTTPTTTMSSTTTTTPTTTTSSTTTTTPTTTTSSTTTTTPTTTMSSTTTTTPTTTTSSTTTTTPTTTTSSTTTTTPTTTTSSTTTTTPTTTTSSTTTTTPTTITSSTTTHTPTTTKTTTNSTTTTTPSLARTAVCNPIEAFSHGEVFDYSTPDIKNKYSSETVAKLNCNTSRGIQKTICIDEIWLPYPEVMCKPPRMKTRFYITHQHRNKRAVGRLDILANFGKGKISEFCTCAEKCLSTPGCTACGWSSDLKHCQLYQMFVSEMKMVESPGYKIAEREDVAELK